MPSQVKLNNSLPFQVANLLEYPDLSILFGIFYFQHSGAHVGRGLAFLQEQGGEITVSSFEAGSESHGFPDSIAKCSA